MSSTGEVNSIAPRGRIDPDWLQIALAAAATAYLMVLCSVLLSPGAVGERTVDTLGSWWMQWWVDHALRTSHTPFQVDVMFYPWGKDLLQDTGGNLVDAFLTVPAARLLGPLIAWNLLAMGIVASNAFTAGAWARWIGAGRSGALAATIVVGLHPYPLFELLRGRPTQALLAPLIAAIALSDFSFREPHGRRAAKLALGAGVMLALTGWTYWYNGLFAAVAITMLAIGRPAGKRFLRLAGVGFVTILLTAPVVLPLLQQLGSGQIRGALPVAQWWANAADAQVPLDLNTLSGDPTQICSVELDGSAWLMAAGASYPEGVAMGLVAALLAAAVLLGPKRYLGPLLLAALLAAGPMPGGHKNPLYLAIAAFTPGLSRLYWPCRALSLTVPISAMGVVAVAALLPVSWRRALPLLLGGLLLGESAARGTWPLPTWDPTVPAGWRCLEGAEGAVIVLPYGRDHEQLLFQTGHELPMLGGMNERSTDLVPEDQIAWRQENAWLKALLQAPIDPRERIRWTEEDRQAIHDLGYRWIAIRPDVLDPTEHIPGGEIRHRIMAMRLREVAGTPVYQDEHVVIYAPFGDLLTCAGQP